MKTRYIATPGLVTVVSLVSTSGDQATVRTQSGETRTLPTAELHERMELAALEAVLGKKVDSEAYDLS
jgi:hypothetical protein